MAWGLWEFAIEHWCFFIYLIMWFQFFSTLRMHGLIRSWTYAAFDIFMILLIKLSCKWFEFCFVWFLHSINLLLLFAIQFLENRIEGVGVIKKKLIFLGNSQWLLYILGIWSLVIYFCRWCSLLTIGKVFNKESNYRTHLRRFRLG